MEDQQVLPEEPGAFLLRGITSDSCKLILGTGLNLIKITHANWERMKERFPQCPVYKQGRDWCLRYPARWSNRPEELLLLLRLFRAGDLAAVANSRFDCAGNVGAMRPYPIFSDFLGKLKYDIQEADLPHLTRFLSELPSLPNWQSVWFGVARTSFLLGSSTEFNLHLAAKHCWMIRRVLDFVTALEATLVPESEFVGQRLRERAPALLGLDACRADELKTRFKGLYDVRSRLAHGSPPTRGEAKVLEAAMPEFEKDVRALLREALRKIPHGDGQRRKEYLRSLYDVGACDYEARAEEFRCHAAKMRRTA